MYLIFLVYSIYIACLFPLCCSNAGNCPHIGISIFSRYEKATLCHLSAKILPDSTNALVFVIPVSSSRAANQFQALSAAIGGALVGFGPLLMASWHAGLKEGLGP